MVLFNQEAGRTDATCPTGLGSLGQRFFASGDERTVTAFPDNYGYKVGANCIVERVWELANMSTTTAKTIYFQVEYTYVPASTAGMRDVEPVWMDIDQCGDSHVPDPRRAELADLDLERQPSRADADRRRPRPRLRHQPRGPQRHHQPGHLRLAGRRSAPTRSTSTTRASSTSRRCRHAGGRGSHRSPQLATGNQVRITSNYNPPAAVPDAMGIAVAYMARDGGTTPPPATDCVTGSQLGPHGGGPGDVAVLLLRLREGQQPVPRPHVPVDAR